MTDNLRRLIRWGIFVLVLWTPLPLGSVQPWAVLVVQLVASLLGLLAVAVTILDPESLSHRSRWLLVPALSLIAIGLIQLLPLPQGVAVLLTGPTAGIRLRVAAVVPEAALSVFPASFSPPETLDALLRLIAYLLTGFAAMIAFPLRDQRARFAMVLCVAGGFQAVYGAAEYLSGHQHIFGYAKKYYLESATGTFINRNHYASYLALALPFAIALLSQRLGRPGTSDPWRRRLVAVASGDGIAMLVLWGAAAAMWVGVLLSYSRGGMLAAFASTGIIALVLLRRRRKALVWIVASTLLLPMLYLGWREIEAPGERFLASEEISTLSLRLPIWSATADAVPRYLPMGAGLGTYADVSPTIRPAELDKRLSHAHNDWLEWILEGGVPLLLVGVLSAWCALRAGVGDALRRALDGGGVTAACGAAGIAIALHSSVDFPLRIPAVAVTVSTVLGVLFAATNAEGPRSLVTRHGMG